MIVNWRPPRAPQRRGGGRARSCAPRPSTPITARSSGPTCTGSATRCRPGDIARADADLDRARPVADATRRSFYRWFLMVAEAGRATFAGRLDEAEPMTEEALALNRRHGDDCFQEHTVGRLALARLRWRPQDADAAQLRGFAARYPHLPVWEAMLASLEWELGNVEAARRGVALCARDDFAAVVRSPDFLPAARVPRRGRCRRGRAVAGRAAVRAA